MARVAVAAAVVIALAVGVWLLWPEDEPTPSTTLPVAGSYTLHSSTSSSIATTTSSTVEAGHVVEKVEEAEAILREFWLAWFRGIYEEDQVALRPLVASEEVLNLARDQFGSMRFLAEPTPQHIRLSEVEILRADDRCLAVWAMLDVSTLTGGATDGVQVFRWIDEAWKYTSLWTYRDDLWQDDC